ncbi:hypothetical protein AYX22_00655 [Arthrobacter sp. D5-1]|nr:hypothetical protein AYX22_00655 [Arthrobacter sp. D5-1]
MLVNGDIPADHTLDPGIVSCWRAAATTSAGVFLCLLALLCYLAPASIVLVLAVCAAALTVALTAVDLLWLIPLRARYFRYALTERGVEIHTGRFLYRRILIPYHQVLYTNVRRGPLLRKYGLESLQIGTLGERFTVPGLKSDVIEHIEETLVSRSAGQYVASE